MKWMKIPRALRDIIEVLLQHKMPWADRKMVACALCRMKWKLNVKPYVPTTVVGLAGRSVELCNDAASQFILKEVWLDKVYEPMVHLQPTSILDLGANQGIAGLYFVQRFESLKRLVMYEPADNCFQLLCGNLPEAEKYREAVGVQDGTLRLVSGGVVNSRVRDQGEGLAVTVVSMRSLLSVSWDLVKMDIEGAEWKVLADLSLTPEWLGRVKYWMIEFHQLEVGAEFRSQIFEAFASQGYKNRLQGDVVHFYHENL
jgi:FkbM family methyltransferase